MEDRTESAAGLTYQDAVPLRLLPADKACASVRGAQITARNALLLRVSIAMQDHHEIEERDQYGAELARLDLKLDLIIACLQQQLGAASALPAPVPITLTPTACRWPAAYGTLLQTRSQAEPPAVPEPNADFPVIAELYINPVLPMPLSLHGRLTGGETPDGEWLVAFDPCGEQQSLLMEKLIFRYHRLAVAMGGNG